MDQKLRSRAAYRGHATRLINESNDPKFIGTLDDATRMELESIKQKMLAKQKTLQERDKEIEDLIADDATLDKEILDTGAYMDTISDALTNICFKLTLPP